jgi:hypothetical protein
MQRRAWVYTDRGGLQNGLATENEPLLVPTVSLDLMSFPLSRPCKNGYRRR